MFTGLIESLGTVTAVDAVPHGTRVQIATTLAPALTLGESIAVNGVCLTAVQTGPTSFVADVGPETLAVTTLGLLRHGDRVNLERSMRADSRMGGHFVQGHVDAQGRVSHVRQDGEFFRITIAFPQTFAAAVVHRGSIAIDGISLTVAALRDGECDVMIIPHTWTHTTLSARPTGAPVNLEFDMLGKYVARAVALSLTAHTS